MQKNKFKLFLSVYNFFIDVNYFIYHICFSYILNHSYTCPLVSRTAARGKRSSLELHTVNPHLYRLQLAIAYREMRCLWRGESLIYEYVYVNLYACVSMYLYLRVCITCSWFRWRTRRKLRQHMENFNNFCIFNTLNKNCCFDGSAVTAAEESKDGGRGSRGRRN